MIRMGATGSIAHLDLCRALETVFRRNGVEFDWVLYSGYDEMVDAFLRGEINLAWNGPLSHVKMRRAMADGAPVLALRDVDVGFTTRFITRADSGIDTVEDLPGKRFAFAARDSVEAGLLPVYFLKQMEIAPSQSLAAADFYDQRESQHSNDQVDVALQVLDHTYDAGAISALAMESLTDAHGIDTGDLRVFWSSPGYSHCCFTARPEVDAGEAAQVTRALVSVDDSDEVGRAVLKAEACDRLVAGIDEGWELVEAAALAEGLIW
ncbi:MAG: phosphate/phosphite/phosphonate ABC transporter substrate-binding protein [Chloroflexi bacterium]|nr:phosphate/phosphite/phosphonate ABC transporter substrate-binding protein [Chloroflexota bacterium]